MLYVQYGTEMIKVVFYIKVSNDEALNAININAMQGLHLHLNFLIKYSASSSAYDDIDTLCIAIYTQLCICLYPYNSQGHCK